MDTKVSVDLLNQALASEWTAYLQYILRSREYYALGYSRLGARLHAISKCERHHARELMDRILFLGGTPAMAPDATPEHSSSVGVGSKKDVSLETSALKLYNTLVCEADENEDAVTSDLFRHILSEEDAHFDHLAKIEALNTRLGSAYLAEQVEL
jgi:bacterioferritin